MAVPVAQSLADTRPTYLEWGPIIGGAIVASALSFLLLTFGSAIGLSLTSAWTDSGARLWVIAFGLLWWMVVVQIGSFAAGAYLAGRMRTTWMGTVADDGRFRDNVHGLLVWAVGVMMGAIVLALVAGSTAKTAAQSTSTVAAGAASGTANRAGPANVGPADYAVDLLLRPASTATSTTTAVTTTTNPSNGDARDSGAVRSEANRIFSSAITNRVLTERDQRYLKQIVVTRTGLSEADADKRVNEAVIEARDLEIKAREQADKARKAAVVTAFIATVSLLISLVVACLAAGLGGRHRDEQRYPHFAGHRFW